jgi:hypothetical protein
MKNRSIVIGLIIGAIIGFALAKIFHSGPNVEVVLPVGTKVAANKEDSTVWIWPDSLDAVKAAPQNHHIIFENDKIRILEVILNPYEYEQLHVHRFPSVMFGAESGSITSGSARSNNSILPFDIIYYRYAYDSIKHTYYVKDSNKQHNGGGKSDESDTGGSGGSNTGSYMRPEGPHRIKNLSNVKIDVFRVEIKPDVKK